MSRLKKHIKQRVGIFVFFGLVLLFTCVVLLGKSQQAVFTLAGEYRIQFSEVHGLFRGSVVTVNGIPAGNVQKIQFLPKTGKVEITVSVISRFESVITSQSLAVLATKGVLGDKFVSISAPGSQTGEVLPPGSLIASSSAGGLMGLLKGEQTKEQVANIVKEFSELLQSLNQGKSFLVSESKSKDVSEILKLLKSILIKIDRGEGTAGALINNKNLYNRVLSLLGQKPYHEYLPALTGEKQ